MSNAAVEHNTLPGTTPAGPLTGLRGVVLTQAWAGTFCTELLGFLGVEVIQIETRRRLDSWRGGVGAPAGRLPGRSTAVHPWNTSPLYNSVNLNKEAITLDLSHPDGLAAFKQLVMTADIVAENFTPRVMSNFGLDFAGLTRIRPGLVMISMSAYGATGPYANTPGIGGTIEPMAGMSALLGYEDGPPINSGQMYPDPVAGYFGAAAVLTALHHRERTGEGQWIDLSMQETSMTFVADALMDFSANRRVRGRLGNHHPSISPHNMYPCADGGWIALSAASDAEFERLCQTAGHAEWAADQRFACATCRKQHETALDTAITAWTETQEAPVIEQTLRAAGVLAAAVRNSQQVLEIETLWQRGMLVRVVHPEAGQHAYAAQPWRLGSTPGGVRLPAPGLGEHSRAVLTGLLGMDEAAYARLEAAGVTGTEPNR